MMGSLCEGEVRIRSGPEQQFCGHSLYFSSVFFDARRPKIPTVNLSTFLTFFLGCCPFGSDLSEGIGRPAPLVAEAGPCAIAFGSVPFGRAVALAVIVAGLGPASSTTLTTTCNQEAPDWRLRFGLPDSACSISRARVEAYSTICSAVLPDCKSVFETRRA